MDGPDAWDIEFTDFNRSCFSSPIDINTCTDQVSPEQSKQREGEGEGEDEEAEIGIGIEVGIAVQVDKEKEKEKEKGSKNTHDLSLPLPLQLQLPLLRHLPNWWYSLSLSTFVEEKTREKEKEKDKRMTSLADMDISTNSRSGSSISKISSESILMKVLSCQILFYPVLLCSVLSCGVLSCGVLSLLPPPGFFSCYLYPCLLFCISYLFLLLALHIRLYISTPFSFNSYAYFDFIIYATFYDPLLPFPSLLFLPLHLHSVSTDTKHVAVHARAVVEESRSTDDIIPLEGHIRSSFLCHMFIKVIDR